MTVPMPVPHPYQHQHQYQPIHHHQEPQQCRQLPYAPMSPNYIARGRVTKACENCKSRKVRCDGICPCERCAGRGLRCIYGERRVRGPTKKRKESRDAATQQVSSSSPTVSLSLRFLVDRLSCWVSRCLCLATATTARRRSNLGQIPHHVHCASPRASPRTCTPTPTPTPPSPATGSATTAPSALITSCFCLVDVALGCPLPISFPLLTTYSCGTDPRICHWTGHRTYLYLPSKRRRPTWRSVGLGSTLVDSRVGYFTGQTC